jgi:Zn-dependent protease
LKQAEIIDLTVSWLTISAAFAFVFSGGLGGLLNFGKFFIIFPISTIAVGTGFIFHELAHRQVAIKFGAHAEYRAWNIGLVFALLSAFMGFIFAAPGAVYIYGPHITRKQNGIISLAGPATNIAVAITFLLLSLFLKGSNFIDLIIMLGARINFFLAMFNLIPFGPLDGRKVFIWSPQIWGAFFAIALIGVLFFEAIINALNIFAV